MLLTLRLGRFALKNILRNKVRSGVILGAIAIGLFSGTFLTAFLNGWIVGSVESDIATQLSHIQIHHTSFLANCDITATFLRSKVEEQIALCSDLSSIAIKTAFRLNLTGMLASPHNSVGITANAVWEEEEVEVTDIWKFIPDSLGAFLPKDTRNAIVISQKIAEKLHVKVRSKVVFSFQDSFGEIQSIAFRVGGIYKTANGAFNEGNVFIRYNDVFEATGLPQGAVHVAALRLPGVEACAIIAPQLQNLLPNMDVQRWSDLNPSLLFLLGYTDFLAYILLGIFLLALSFGIINTMMMAVLERSYELRMLWAIGMTKGKIFGMIMLETLYLTFLGSVVGIFLGFVLLLPTLKSGIDLSFVISDQFEDYGFSSIVTPVIDQQMFVQIAVLVIVAGVLSAIYPAKKAINGLHIKR